MSCNLFTVFVLFVFFFSERAAQWKRVCPYEDLIAVLATYDMHKEYERRWNVFRCAWVHAVIVASNATC